MINTFRLVSRQNLHRQLRQFHKCVIQRTESDAAAATVATPSTPPPPPPSSSLDAKPVDPKIDRIVSEITALNLIEVAELSDLLKKRLNLPDAPVMPVGGFAAAPQPAEEEEVKKLVQTAFTVRLTAFDEKQKVALIKEIKTLLPNTNLVQAKKFVESIPVVVKADIEKDEAQKLKETLAKVGATAEIL